MAWELPVESSASWCGDVETDGAPWQVSGFDYESQKKGVAMKK
jgi:hypothetical protein